jgi:DNA mismatch repair ATPase MutS
VKLSAYLDQRRNEFFAIISVVLLWATQFTFAIEAWRRRHGPEIESWLANFGEFEALCALAGYAYEHPGDPFPEIVEGETVLEAEEVRHPLIAPSVCVPNSIHLGGELQLLLVSGSNMSGKSTLLRTVGINAVLAMAGGPVRAKRMKLSVLAIGATLRVQDSLQAGVSRFYAEIQRLHDTMELTSGDLPALFLLDEILHGTNSHDRAIGAEAIVRGLIERGAIGLVTTHDLALARVVEALAPRAKNVHFEDHLENGRMTFDYVLHPGVVQKSNALELMRAVGLKV